MPTEKQNPMDNITLQELLLLLGEKEAEIYRLRRNVAAMAAKLDELETAAKRKKEK